MLHLGKLHSKNPECLPETEKETPPSDACLEAQALLGLGGFYERQGLEDKGNADGEDHDQDRSGSLETEEEERDDDDEDFDVEDMSEADRLSPTPCPSLNGNAHNMIISTQCKELHRQKVERVAQKIKKLLGDLHIPEVIAGQKQLEREVASTLTSMSPQRIMKKTVNQTTATVAFFVLKKLSAPISVKQVVQTLKDGERTRSLSRSTKPNYSRNHADVLGISKLVSSLEYNPSLLEEQPHSKSCLEATRNLAKALNCPEDVENLACTYSALSEQSTLASRHSGSVAAGCVVLAAKTLGHKLTLTSVSSASGVSGCTIRKAMRAMEPLVDPAKPV